MAGGQERILRGRIRSMQATKKITRAMELIAASRIVKAQQRVQAAVPYSEQITEVVRDLAAAGASSDSPLLAGRGEVRTTCYVVITADRGLCGGYNAGVQRAAEGEVKADVLAGKGYAIIPVGRKAESYFRFRGYTARPGVRRLQREPDLRGRQAHRSARRRAVTPAARSTASSWSTPGSSRPAARRSCCARWCRSPPRPSPAATARPDAEGTAGDYEFEPDPTARSSRRCCRATSRPASTPPCSTPRPPSTPSASGR